MSATIEAPERPDDVGPVPGFPEVKVYRSNHGCDEVTGEVWIWIKYCGWPDDLIAAGIATAEMLGPKVKGRKRIDTDGNPYKVSRYWRLRNGQPQGYYQLYRLKTAKLLDTLPGGLGAVTAYLRQEMARPQSAGGTAEYREYRRRIEQEADASLRQLSRAIMRPALRQLIDAVETPGATS